MFILPNGPSISTVLLGSLRLTTWLRTFTGGGSSILNVTSGGTESGARPILERHRVLVEKWEFDVRDGTRKVGIDTSWLRDVANTARKAFDERV